MWEYGIVICILLVWICLCIEHFPKQKVINNRELVHLIHENGLVHFTRLENKDSILKNGLIPCKKNSMSFWERGFVWCYIYDESKVKDCINDVIFEKDKAGKNSNGRKCEIGIRIENITDEQISRMRYHKRKGYVAYKGNLKTEKMYIVSFVDKLK